MATAARKLRRKGLASTTVAGKNVFMRRVDQIPELQKRVLPKSMVFTDELRSYRGLPGLGYGHGRVSHSAKVWVRGAAHTNTIEGFWSLMKRGIAGVYHGVSTEHLQSYLDEYAFRYNHRDDPRGMFHAFLGRIVKVSA